MVGRCPPSCLLALAALGTWDLLQTRHTILRLYPILGHVRFLMELIRPEIRQYFIESNTEAAPFDRETRDLVYERAKGTKGDEPFGTERDVNAVGYEFLRHSLRARFADELDPSVRLGGPDCTQPYDIALLNVSAMSFGALSANAIEALNAGAARGGFAHDTGEGGISPYHLRGGGDLIWEIGSGYFGCRDADGRFDPATFAEKAPLPAVKAISVKLSQGAKPGLGGVLPGAKVSAEIAATRGVPHGTNGGLATRTQRVRHAGASSSSSSRPCAGCPAASRSASSSASARAPSSCRSARPSWPPASLRTSSSSTAPRAAPARRRRSSRTTSACR